MSKEAALNFLTPSDLRVCKSIFDSCPGYVEISDKKMGKGEICLVEDQPGAEVYGPNNWGKIKPKENCPKGY
ncbi:hypothetical protein ACFL1M_00435 [Patescibacteria group bacterium]